MPKKSNLKKILILGSGPIVIGQACEFDYSGTQACKALMQEGLEVILVNSNPATIMTDPNIASKIYIEPLKISFIEKILDKERPDAIIPTLGGQTALNLALELHDNDILNKFNVELLGANAEVIRRAEDREKFREILDDIGAFYPQSKLVRSFEEGLEFTHVIGYPVILRPNYTLGGGGGGVAYSQEDFQQMLAFALNESPSHEVLLEESVLGWKEFELEVMRDKNGTFVVICSIENFDPCGVHTGDSITVAPQQTLSEEEYQSMRSEAYKIINAVGVETGGANIQFAVHPENGKRVVIEMNPRVSRSSALASKATGFPIAKIAALLSIGYTLDEIRNDITGTTPCCYEPALDYVVTKIPRFAFEKFYGSKDILSTQMKSVGEVMSIGRTFKESLVKALVSLELHDEGIPEIEYQEKLISYPNSKRILYIFQAFREGKSIDEVYDLTSISKWFLEQIKNITDLEKEIILTSHLDRDLLLKAKRFGLSDARIAKLKKMSKKRIRDLRQNFNIRPGFNQVDTCAGEFSSNTSYFYSTYWNEYIEKTFKDNQNDNLILILGSGPNRIGQGIEFDYCCVRGVKRLRKEGFKVAMVNSNPETVSTDYDTSDLLFFEPLVEENIIEILKFLNPKGFIAQLGGQTPINIAPKLVNEGFNLLGSNLDTIDLAEDRGKFSALCKELGFAVPEASMLASFEEAKHIISYIGFPVICRPSYVLGGRRMEVIENMEELESYFDRHIDAISVESPCLIDQFLEGALEVDVDLVKGMDWIVIGGIVEHIEAAGVHSGDSMGVLPPQRLKKEICDTIEKLSIKLSKRLDVIGHLNIQLAIKNDKIFILEANPRSSRSVPFIAKATGIPLVDLAVLAILGKKEEDLNTKRFDWRNNSYVSVKGVVFPFKKFPEADSLLGPEMKSTGESMGRGKDYSEALLKAFFSSKMDLPLKGEVFLSLKDKDKPLLVDLAKKLIKMGYTLSATKGTAIFFNKNDVPCTMIKKIREGRPHCVDRIRSGQIVLVINTTSGKKSIEASFNIRRSCIDYSVPCLTENDAADVMLLALEKHHTGQFDVSCLDGEYII